MRAVRQANTAPERAVRLMLRQAGYRIRTNVRSLPGRPDVVLPTRKLPVFVHGCFWHRHVGCRRATTPASNQEFWADKFTRNQQRDSARIRELSAAGWRVLVVWECALSGDEAFRLRYLRQIMRFVRGTGRFGQVPRRPPR